MYLVCGEALFDFFSEDDAGGQASKVNFKAIAGGSPFNVAVGLRRLGVLFLFGVTHALALWYGDILHLYAVTGAIVLFMIKRSVRALVITASVLMQS